MDGWREQLDSNFNAANIEDTKFDDDWHFQSPSRIYFLVLVYDDALNKIFKMWNKNSCPMSK